MAQVKLSWPPSPVDEGVTGYQVKMDDALVGSPAVAELTLEVAPGVHSFSVAPVNIWGAGPQSDAVSTPKAASKIASLTFTIVA